MRRTEAGAVNAQQVTGVVYGPDPNGWAMFRGLSRVLQRDVQGQAVPAVIERSDTFDGYGQSPQRFIGLAGLAAGRQRALLDRNSQLADENTSSTDPALRIFAARLARQGKL